MNQLPLVSVICLCHNHAAFVKEAIESVLNQDYANVELIVVNDGSTDNSREEILSLLSGSQISFIDLDRSLGNCKAFNIGFKKSSGEFIIDLAADDILLPNRIKKGLDSFSTKEIGVEYCNVLNVEPDGKEIGLHFESDTKKPEGDIYIDLVSRYFISPPGMMIRRKVLEDLNGYDENLSYEDFDFWIRSGRNYSYGYTDEVLVKKRNVKNSLSKRQFDFRNKHQLSTLRVCGKIKELNQSKEEDLALRMRCWYEIRRCVKQGNLELIPAFLKLI